MYRLFYIKFYDKSARLVVRKEYEGLQFGNERYLEMFKQSEKKAFQEMFGIELNLVPHDKEVPEFDVPDLIHSYCRASGFTYEQIVGSGGRKREFVEVRGFITLTAIELGFVHGQLRPFFPNGNSYHYETTMRNLLETNNDIQLRWEETESTVMNELRPRFKENGSGTKID